MSFERESIRRMHGYRYGEQPEDPAVIKLNTNENAYPPSPAVAAALAAFDVALLRRYPAATADGFRRLAAARLGVTPDEILVTNGGDELLRLAVTTFLDPGTPLGTAAPSYSLYPVLASVHGCPTAAVPLGDDWRVPRDFAPRLNDEGAKLTCLVNPHAPSGALTGVDTLARIADALDGVLLIDEAYVDFVDPARDHDAVPLIRAFDNVLILRSLSKGYSLAGLRFGFALGNPSLITPMLTKTRDSYNVDAISQALAEAAFADTAYAEETWRRTREERRRLCAGLGTRGFEVPASESNFVLATVPAGRTGASLYAGLAARGILVRHFDTPPLENRLRITVGTPADNDALLAALDALLADA